MLLGNFFIYFSDEYYTFCNITNSKRESKENGATLGKYDNKIALAKKVRNLLIFVLSRISKYNMRMKNSAYDYKFVPFSQSHEC